MCSGSVCFQVKWHIIWVQIRAQGGEKLFSDPWVFGSVFWTWRELNQLACSLWTAKFSTHGALLQRRSPLHRGGSGMIISRSQTVYICHLSYRRGFEMKIKPASVNSEWRSTSLCSPKPLEQHKPELNFSKPKVNQQSNHKFTPVNSHLCEFVCVCVCDIRPGLVSSSAIRVGGPRLLGSSPRSDQHLSLSSFLCSWIR